MEKESKNHAGDSSVRGEAAGIEDVSKVSAVSLWWIRPVPNAPLSGVRAMRHMGASDGDLSASKRA
ncbi:hypothetical protein TIFTF001_028216 [Ficus carica]|uniref:Uncharacterized protein n=1 Tax=Ficus carica TaxID=3494 RepID=A0AA88DPM8_FICCA|nr:hypothetical protein TIFTF001_028216 [Ficus carica]